MTRCIAQRSKARGSLLPLAVVATALVALLAFAPFASAATDPVASGSTTITLNKGLLKKLKKKKVKVLKVSPAKLKGRKATFSVSGGEVDPTTGAGTLTHTGGLKFKAGRKSVVLKNLVVNTTKKSLTGKLGGKNVKFASLSGISATRNGFGADLAAKRLKLTGAAAKRLNKKLRLKKVFKGGQTFASSASTEQPKTVTVLPGGTTSLTTDLSTVTKFAGLGVTIAPIAPAEEELPPVPPVLKFPISGGTIAPDATDGVMQTTGGVKLSQEPFPGIVTTVTLNAIWLDLQTKTATVEVTIETNAPETTSPGNIGRNSIADVSLTGATVKSDPVAHTVTVENATATLQAVTAETLNQTFAGKAQVFQAGDGLGTFTFTAQTQ